MLARHALINRVIGLAIEMHRIIGPVFLNPSTASACPMSAGRHRLM
jgi:hypothetical protein